MRRNLLTIVGIATGLCMSFLINAQVPRQTVRGYPKLDPKHVYHPGEQVRVDKPHGVYSGLMSMDRTYFVRPVEVTIAEQDKVGSKGILTADVRHAVSVAWERWTFSYACDYLSLTVGQLEVASEGDESEDMQIGSHNEVCALRPLDANGRSIGQPVR
jgi:hypothetical protein